MGVGWRWGGTLLESMIQNLKTCIRNAIRILLYSQCMSRPHFVTISVCIWMSVLVHRFLPTLLCKTKMKRRTLAFLFFQPCGTGESEEAHKKNFVVQPARTRKSCFQTQFRKLFLHLKKNQCSFSWQRNRKM